MNTMNETHSSIFHPKTYLQCLQQQHGAFEVWNIWYFLWGWFWSCFLAKNLSNMCLTQKIVSSLVLGVPQHFFLFMTSFCLLYELWDQDTDNRLLKEGFRKKTDPLKPWSAVGVGIQTHIQKNCHQFSTPKWLGNLIKHLFLNQLDPAMDQ